MKNLMPLGFLFLFFATLLSCNNTPKTENSDTPNNSTKEQSSTAENEDNTSSSKEHKTKTYKTIDVDGLIWMAENLNTDLGEGCSCPDDNPENCKKYGRLYDLRLLKADEICPKGWRLPTRKEAKALLNWAGGYITYDWDSQRDGAGMGNKVTKGNPQKAFNKLRDKDGFSAKFGGFYMDGSTYSIGEVGTYLLHPKGWKQISPGANRIISFDKKKKEVSFLDGAEVASCRCVKE